MGEQNSSVTRVWPVFDCLLHRDASGRDWLPGLLEMAPVRLPGGRKPDEYGPLLPTVARRERAIPGNLKRVLGQENVRKIGALRNAFEADIPPPQAFLEWMLKNPDRLSWPNDRKGNPREFSSRTQSLRKRLLGGYKEVQAAGLAALGAAGRKDARKKWWAFEGWTSADCLLETETLLLLIEGKRTEQLSVATDWYPGRNQLVRNVEVAEALAKATHKEEYGVLLCAEQPIELPAALFDTSLPHLDETRRNEFRKHYLGCITWKQICHELCREMTLPGALAEAVALCLSKR